MKITAPVKPAIPYEPNSRGESARNRDLVPGAEPLHRVWCGLCNSTGHTWVQCRDAGPVKIRCSCGAKQIADGFAELRITALVALFFTIVMLGVLYFLGNPSTIF